MAESANERPRNRTGILSAGLLALVLIVALACLAFAVYGYLQARNRIDGLSNLVPLRETVVMRADGPTVVRQVQRLSKLETSRYTLEKILDAERTRQYVPSFLAGEKIIFVAHGQVVAGIDLSQISEEDITVTGDSISMRLPEPEILYSRIDNEKSYVYERETGILSDPDKDLEGQIRAEAERQIRDSAMEDGILDEAQAGAKQTLEALFRSMGYTDVTFR